MPVHMVDDVALYYEEIGSGPAFLMVHGSGGNASTWGESLSTIAERGTVITYDRRGFSRTVHPPIADWRRHALDAAALLAARSGAPATVVGWSAGANVAVRLSLLSPALVGALVLIEPPWNIVSRATSALREAVRRLRRLEQQGDRPGAALTFFRWATGYSSGGNAFDRFPDRWRSDHLANAEAVLYEMTTVELSASELRAVRCPVTVLVGDRSQPEFVMSAAAVTELLQQTTVATVLVPGAGHMIPFDQPLVFAGAVLSAAPASPRSGDVRNAASVNPPYIEETR